MKKLSREIKYIDGIPQKSELMIENSKRYKRRRKLRKIIEKLPFLRNID